RGSRTGGEAPREGYERPMAACARAEAFLVDRARTPRPFGAERVPPLPAEDRRRVYLAVAPVLRQLATAPLDETGSGARLYRALRFDDGPDVLDFAGSEKALALAAVGPATPDHLIHTKLRPLFAPWQAPTDMAAAEHTLRRAWDEYAVEYGDYVRQGGRSGGLEEAAGGRVPAAIVAEAAAPRPRVVLLPGIGMVTIGKDER